MTENGGNRIITPAEALALEWSIIPINRTKKPMLTSWKAYQTRRPTPQEVEKWMQWKPAGWALIAGAVSQRFVLDFDGEPGRRTLQALALEPHAHRQTPSGGYHVDIVQPDWKVPTLNSKTKTELNARWPGLDIRGDGGYALFAGAINGGEYTWLRPPDAHPIRILPQDLIDFMHPPAEPPAPAAPGFNYTAAETELITKALAQAKQGRNAAGFWMAAQLRDNGYSESTAAEIMLEYRRRCPATNTKGQAEEYTEAEALASLKQAYGRAARGPWIVPSRKPAADANNPTPPNFDRAVALVNGAAGAAPNQPDEPEPAHEAPATRPKHFISTPTAIFYTDEEDDRKIFVCSRLEVVAYARDANSESWGRYLRWWDAAGVEHHWVCHMRMLAGDGIAFRETLADLGLEIGTAAKANSLLVQYVRSEKPDKWIFCLPHVGWFEPESPDRAFVFPDSTIPEFASVAFQSAGRGEHFYRTKGTLESWQENISKKCVGNSRLIFAVSAAFAGPLMRPLGVDGGGFHFHGTSSTGKSTTQWVAGSVWGGGGRNGFARTWSATKNALESTAELHNDGCLILDEIRMIDPREVEQVVYMLANGVGKSRETRTMSGRRTLQWLLMVLSSGEIQLADCAALAGTKIKGGAEIRIATIPAEAGAMGIFETLHDTEDPRVFADVLKAASKEHYGEPIREFLKCLVENWDGILSEARQFIGEFIADNKRQGSASEIGRVLLRFALVACAGELATELGLTRWPEGEAEEAARVCFNAWIHNRGGIEATDTINGLRQIRDIIAAEQDRFRPADPEKNADGQIITPDHVRRALGYWKRIDGELVYLVDQGAFKKELCAGFEWRDIATELKNRGYLHINEKNRLTTKQQVTLPTGDITNPDRVRFYGIRSAILEIGGE